MNVLFKILLWGCVISFLGALPLGTLNVLATKITVQSGMHIALGFSAGAVLVEMIYVSVALKGMDKILAYPVVFRCLEWFSVLVLLLLGAACFVATGESGGFSQVLPSTFPDAFWMGLLLSATTPMHITFWFGWSTVLIEKRILVAGNRNYAFYVAGIGIGSLLGFAVFIVGGSYLVNLLHNNQHWVNRIVGTILLITGLIQSVKIIRKYQTTPA